MKTIFVTDSYFLIPLGLFCKTNKEVAIEIDDMTFDFLLKLYFNSKYNVGSCILID